MRMLTSRSLVHALALLLQFRRQLLWYGLSPPSEYARADVASPSVWSQMRATSLKSLSDSVCMSPRVSSSYFIDSLPIVAAREWSYGPRRVMQIDTMDDPQDALYTRFGEVGDIVCIRLNET